jgi:hypothetical protein
LLDETHATLVFSPGGSYWGGDVFSALVKVGDAAVVPILDAIDSDRRFTRSMVPSRHRGPSYGTQLVPVRVPLYQALTEIWPAARAIRSAYPEGTNQLRRAWETHRTLNIGERWAQVIRDLQLTPLAWSQAAAELPKVELSIQTRDEVATWLERRAIELTSPRKVATFTAIRDAGYALGFALVRHELLPKQSAQVLKEISENALALIEMNPAYVSEREFMKNLATLISIRVREGEKDAPGQQERLQKLVPKIQ